MFPLLAGNALLISNEVKRRGKVPWQSMAERCRNVSARMSKSGPEGGAVPDLRNADRYAAQSLYGVGGNVLTIVRLVGGNPAVEGSWGGVKV